MTYRLPGSPILAVAAMLLCSACDRTNQSETAAMQATADSGITPAVAETTASAPPRNPPELDRIIADRRKGCDGEVGQGFGKTLTADFNADGKTDYVISDDRFLCADEGGGQSAWGRAGPHNEFLVSSPSGYALSDGFGSYLDASNIKGRRQGDVIQLDWEDMSSEGCAGKFTATWSWTGKKMDLTDRRNAKGQKVDELGCAASASGNLPIKLGYYGYDGAGVDPCTLTDGVTITAKDFVDIDGYYPLRPVRKLGNGRYQLGESYNIEVTGPDRFAVWVAGDSRSETERRLVWCAAKAPK